MPTSLESPLERSRGLQPHWERLLQRYPMPPNWSFGLVTTSSIGCRHEIPMTTMTTMRKTTT